jgi:hypothetical protein
VIADWKAYWSFSYAASHREGFVLPGTLRIAEVNLHIRSNLAFPHIYMACSLQA